MLTEFDFEDIYIRHAKDDEPDLTAYKMHIHSRCEIFFFISGHVDYLVEGSRYHLNENNVMIMRPSESHTARILDHSPYERFAINFPLSFFKSFDPSGLLDRAFVERPLGQGNLFTENQLDMENVKRLFLEMIEAQGPEERKIVFHTHVGMLLYLISQAYAERKNSETKNPSLCERIAIYINKHLFEELTIDQLSEHFNLSSSQFTRVFRKGIGSSPWEYILRKRLTAAREMLKKGCKVQEACEKCGFFDYSSFYRSYVKYFEESPAATRSNS